MRAWPPNPFENMPNDTLALEQTLLQYLQDDHLSKAESRDLRAALQAHSREELNFLRNRLFELARDRLSASSAQASSQGQDTSLAIIGWLGRCSKAIQLELGERLNEHRAYFSPGEQCLEQIQQQLGNARSRIDICVFTISDNRISDAILAAHQRQVQVRIITDNHKQQDAGSDVEWLLRAGITIRFDRTPDHMHHKFCIVDGLNLINGSFNWTRSASERNQENIVISQDAALVRQFQNEFDALWDAFA